MPSCRAPRGGASTPSFASASDRGASTSLSVKDRSCPLPGSRSAGGTSRRTTRSALRGWYEPPYDSTTHATLVSAFEHVGRASGASVDGERASAPGRLVSTPGGLVSTPGRLVSARAGSFRRQAGSFRRRAGSSGRQADSSRRSPTTIRTSGDRRRAPGRRRTRAPARRATPGLTRSVKPGRWLRGSPSASRAPSGVARGRRRHPAGGRARAGRIQTIRCAPRCRRRPRIPRPWREGREAIPRRRARGLARSRGGASSIVIRRRCPGQRACK
jgi:hypothetical protein